jgi:hypothetical protein
LVANCEVWTSSASPVFTDFQWRTFSSSAQGLPNEKKPDQDDRCWGVVLPDLSLTVARRSRYPSPHARSIAPRDDVLARNRRGFVVDRGGAASSHTGTITSGTIKARWWVHAHSGEERGLPWPSAP